MKSHVIISTNWGLLSTLMVRIATELPIWSENLLQGQTQIIPEIRPWILKLGEWCGKVAIMLIYAAGFEPKG